MSKSPNMVLLLWTTALLCLCCCGTEVDAVRDLPRRRQLFASADKDDGHRRQVEVEQPTGPEDHRVTNLPFLDPASFTTPHYAGLLPASKGGDKYFFYWFFHPDTTAIREEIKDEEIPLILWLNGGPGCSSMDGLWLENGPLQLTHDHTHWKIVPRQASWHKSPAYVVYVDQPVGTGLSFTTSRKYPRNDKEVNIDFYYWLKKFLKLHANVLLTEDGTALKRPFYFSGESHAGHYIPHMIDYIIQQNREDHLRIDVAGAAIGNGWVDPKHQYAVATAAYGFGIIDMAQKNALDEKEKACQNLLDRGTYSAGVCFDLLDDVLRQAEGSRSMYKISQYDVTKIEPRHGSRNYPPGHKEIESFLGGHPTPPGVPPMMNNDVSVDTILKALHATSSRQAGQVYRECTDPPYNALSHQDGKGVVENVATVLNGGTTKFLFFNGVLDMICNHVGNEVFLQNLPWEHQKDWILAPRYVWIAPSQHDKTKVSGYMKEYGNLSFLKVRDSGHMVPLDIPEIALDMIRNFVYNKGFQTHKQDLKLAVDPPSSCPVCKDCPVSNGDMTLIDNNNKKDEEDENKGRAAASPADFAWGDDSIPGANDVSFDLKQYAWVGAFVLFAAVVGFFVGRRRASNFRHSCSSSSKQYEMQNYYRPTSYRDDSDDDDDDDKEEEDDNNDDDDEEEEVENRTSAEIRLV